MIATFSPTHCLHSPASVSLRISPTGCTFSDGQGVCYSLRSTSGSKPRRTTWSRIMVGIGVMYSLSAERLCSTGYSRWRRIPCILLVSVFRFFSRVIELMILGWVGYAGYYGLSMIVGSYPVLFVSLATHAAQFAFLVLFENPRQCYTFH